MNYKYTKYKRKYLKLANNNSNNKLKYKIKNIF